VLDSDDHHVTALGAEHDAPVARANSEVASPVAPERSGSRDVRPLLESSEDGFDPDSDDHGQEAQFGFGFRSDSDGHLVYITHQPGSCNSRHAWGALPHEGISHVAIRPLPAAQDWRARLIQHLRAARLSLEAIRRRIAPLSDEQVRALLPPEPRAVAPDGVPPPPPAPTYPSVPWQVVTLMDGLVLLVNPNRGAVLQRIAAEIYHHYGMK
jgi:hypothetical protein